MVAAVVGARDLVHLRAALDAAVLGPAADPNPRVGCVITDSAGVQLGVGYHRGAGTAHAEVDALLRVRESGVSPVGGTAYVTLEPCNHTGRTGPCAMALVESGVSRVVVLRHDAGVLSGRGAQTLRAAGVRVDSVPQWCRDAGQSDEARCARELVAQAGDLVREWEFAVLQGRPWVTWKFAATLDGRSAAADGSSKWITGLQARADVHVRRAAAGAIVVGTGTVLADDPALTVRDSSGGLVGRQPLRVVVGCRDVPGDARVFMTDRSAPSLLPALHLRTRDPQVVLAQLHARQVRHVWLEGGPTLAAAFVRAGLVDEVVAYVAPALLGSGVGAVGDLGVSSMSQVRRFELCEVERVGADVRCVLRVPGAVHEERVSGVSVPERSVA
ncbi:bifunctional diaminohydroxyphosphoribosylaminopyrimidine deaminase/5-amino-6-(5-phosphoribosylamino)uracil reductase RibD [Dermatophilus congolensis]|uniref:bifunctional diaminohydroxyphosphoribosylaminopyrimidine deaminase/5-amino-6-(5-phosphoribosylamino)uracil reductase RibD n=1 Tax=Dermatophilus congolensis TaxID=1863 RepID=UPI001AAE709E|nr:bifunctional diaminohydroxyphosphoribosylaminopyrimidine deaminase/5-amino-6-(5-phosphoribosylamino)uracil reductase RibD [Dermatophilus congolensis]MBO3142445.1 bifunctional diaminohydroxyphosphoribosylaminopyrimidine deaminase/5-amino-6-(5-phosphoribosylamino)uracil reductase RibD [Dermatophilus congolensis]MBO3151434.1 bifunctional diaminohydroxyphosphoribosylaminopyrimidine deaminase/5-amino-6-(5-phosphoribosylamino)uracil reductase RibD [Dermatophilus congolensis]MBO3161562.1 bifunctiona